MKPDWCPQDVWDDATLLNARLGIGSEPDDIRESARALLSAYNRGLEDAAGLVEEFPKYKAPETIAASIRAKIKHGGE